MHLLIYVCNTCIVHIICDIILAWLLPSPSSCSVKSLIPRSCWDFLTTGYYPCIKISELNLWSFSPSSWSPSNWWHETLVSSLFGYKNPNVKKQTLLRCLLCLIRLMRNLLLITLDGMQWKPRWNSSWSTTFVFTVVEDGALFFFPPFVVLPDLPELWRNFADEFMACLQICHVET